MTLTEELPVVTDEPDYDPLSPPSLRSRISSSVPSRFRRKARTGPPPPLAPWAVRSLWAFLVVSILAAWILVYAIFFSALHEHRAQQVLFAKFRSELVAETAPVGGQIPLGQPVAILQAPAAGIHSVVIVQGTSAQQLESGPGHLADTPMPGQFGQSVIFGRGATFGAPFENLVNLRPRNGITVITGQGTFTYLVTDVRYPGDHNPPALAVGASRLTLVSSVGSGWRYGWAPQHVIYVDATLQKGSHPGPSSSQDPTSVPSSAQAMAADTSHVATLAFWIEGVLVFEIALLWGSRRWGGWQMWMVGVPIGLAILWGATGSGLLLLPNLV